jgi:hypothetical protein
LLLALIATLRSTIRLSARDKSSHIKPSRFAAQ